MRGEPVAAEAGVTLQQPEACHVFSQGSCPWIMVSWQWRLHRLPGGEVWRVTCARTQASWWFQQQPQAFMTIPDVRADSRSSRQSLKLNLGGDLNPLSCVETFPPSQLHPRGADPVPILLSLFFLFSFALARYVGCFLPFGKSEVSCQCSVGVRRSCSTCRCIFDVFVGRKEISTSYSSAILKVPLFLCLDYL